MDPIWTYGPPCEKDRFGPESQSLREEWPEE
jgi:hypothetical protein